MKPATTFEERWQQGVEFRLPEQEKADPRCQPARELAAICEPMVEKVRQAPEELAINVALLQLQHQYFRHYERASKTHRNHIGMRTGHICLWQIYYLVYGQLYDLLLKVNPPPLRPPPPPAPRPHVQGIFLGEEV